ncbi:MAG: hypothetical protein WD875_17230 [Pirellulales bacterium]
MCETALDNCGETEIGVEEVDEAEVAVEEVPVDIEGPATGAIGPSTVDDTPPLGSITRCVPALNGVAVRNSRGSSVSTNIRRDWRLLSLRKRLENMDLERVCGPRRMATTWDMPEKRNARLLNGVTFRIR